MRDCNILYHGKDPYQPTSQPLPVDYINCQLLITKMVKSCYLVDFLSPGCGAAQGKCEDAHCGYLQYLV